jgi:hypothetical protein
MAENRLSAWIAVRSPRINVLLPLAFLPWCFSCLAPGNMRASGGAGPGQQGPDPPELFHQLNIASIDPSQVYALRDAQIVRDRVKIYFNRGFVGFLKQTTGEVNGAVFTGDGELLLTPPTAVEKLSLARFTQTPIMEERFTTAYLRFTDATARDLLAQAHRNQSNSRRVSSSSGTRWYCVSTPITQGASCRIWWGTALVRISMRRSEE